MTNQQVIKTILSANPSIVLNNQGKILSSIQLTKTEHILGRDPQKADLVVPEDWNVVSRVQATFKKVGSNYYIHDGDGINPSSNRLYINNKLITPQDGYCLHNEDQIKIGQNQSNLILITYHDPSASFKVSTPKLSSVSLKNKSVILGRDPTANLQLEAPTISRKHAVIDTDPQGNYILYDYSTNGVFVNDTKVSGKAVLLPGSIIKIGPYTLKLQGDELVVADRGDNIRLDANRILRIVQGKNNQPIVLLNNISIPIEPGQFVALVGGSGAGKSTFMRTLLGIEPITKLNNEPHVKQGVYINGEDLRKNFNIYRNQIVYVPQTDIVHKDLKVEEVLYYAAKLRLPPDTNIKQVVEETLAQIEMTERRDVLVKNLSGGQLKRVSIGVELLADPKLFFLDEPTSGLDPGLDKKMMQLLRKLADQGRTVILVTHATSNITLCDRIVFLGRGGNLCYFGPPQEASQFFGLNNGDFADIYIKLETKEAVADSTEKYKNSTYQKTYIDARLGEGNDTSPQAKPKKVKASFFQQLLILVERYFQLVIRDKVNLILALVTAPVGIFLINLALKEKEPLVLGVDDDSSLAPLALRVLFVFTCAAIWVGLSSSLQEIVKEGAIYARERLVNLGLFAYLNSKIIILGGLAFIQAILMSITIIICFNSPQPETLPWFLGILITSFLTLFTCICLGLMVSSSVSNSTQANSALPILLLPQIIFSGVLFNMEGAAKYVSWFMLSRWSVGAYGALVDVNGLVPEPITLFDGTEIPQPFEPSPVYDPIWNNLLLNWGILLLHSLVYLGIAYFLQKRKDVL
jgi:putative ABC transport system ATP-binding protein